MIENLHLVGGLFTGNDTIHPVGFFESPNPPRESRYPYQYTRCCLTILHRFLLDEDPRDPKRCRCYPQSTVAVLARTPEAEASTVAVTE